MTFIEQAHKTSTNVLEVIKKASIYEFSQNYEIQAEILKDIWGDFNDEPNVTGYPGLVTGELYRICGFFLSNYGRSKGIKDYQERAKNYLTNAIDCFNESQLFDKAAKTRCHLANCYLNEGEEREAESTLLFAEQEFTDSSHPSFLRIQVNLLLVFSKLNKLTE